MRRQEELNRTETKRLMEMQFVRRHTEELKRVEEETQMATKRLTEMRSSYISLN